MSAAEPLHVPDGLPLMLRHVSESMGVDVDEELLGAACRVDGDWKRRLEHVLPTLGLSPRWMLIGPKEVAVRARPDLPLVSWVDDELGGSWVIVSQSRWGKVELMSIGFEAPIQWVSPTRALGRETRAWAQVVPILPSSPLSAAGGKGPVSRLFSLLSAERSDVGVVVTFAVVIGLLSLATPLAIQLLINWLAFGALLQPVVTLGVVLLVCLTFAAGLRAAQRHAIEIVQRRIFARAVADLSARLVRVRVSSFDGSYGPELANRFFDVLTLQKAASTLLLDGLAAALQAAVGLGVLALYHPLLLAFDVGVVLLIAAVLIPTGTGAMRTAIVESKKKYAVAAWLEELAKRPSVFKLGGTELAESRSDALADAYLTARERHFGVFLRQYVGMQSIAVVVPTLLLVMAGWLVLEGELTLGQLVAAEFIVASALAGLAKFTEKLETVYDLLAGVDKLSSLFDLPLERSGGMHRAERSGPAAVALRGVSFGHVGARSLGPVDFDMEAGARIVVVGDQGTGKSTLGELVVGLREPTAGAVTRDGISMGSLLTSELFDESMILAADGCFGGTLRNNITLGNRVPDEEVLRAVNAAGLNECIRDLDAGLETPLTSAGGPLSSIQRRAVVLARAIVLKPRLLVLDGLLDGIPEPRRKQWWKLVMNGDEPWTLLVLTAERGLEAGCETWELTDGRLQCVE